MARKGEEVGLGEDGFLNKKNKAEAKPSSSWVK
jgi:hypothetical protein